MSSSLGRRRRRILGDDERQLWAKVAASVTPLDPTPRRDVIEPAPSEPAVETPAADRAPPPAPAPVAPRRAKKTPPPADPSPPSVGPTRRGLAGWARAIHMKHRGADPEAAILPRPPSLAPMDDRTKRRLVRGTMAIDERLDLHGFTQDAAHAVLRRFLVSARDRGARVVLVITGKGKPNAATAGGHDRGILRRAVPHWLGDPSLRDVVVGFEEAHLAHGGSGAIYVRLRRRRDHREDER